MRTFNFRFASGGRAPLPAFDPRALGRQDRLPPMGGAFPERHNLVPARWDSRNFEFNFADPHRPESRSRRVEVNNGLARDARTGAVLFSLVESDVHVPQEMTTYLAGYKPFGFSADIASKVVMVSKDEDFHRDFSSDNAFRHVNVKAGPEGAVPEIDAVSSTTKYKTVDRLLGSFVSLVTEEQANPNYRVRQVAARRIGNALALDREIDVFDSTIGLLGNASNWNSNNVTTLGSTTFWGTGSAADPLHDIDAILGTQSTQPVSEVLMPYDIFLVFIKHPSVRDMMRQVYGDDNTVAEFLKMVEQGGRGGAPARDGFSFVIPGYPPFRAVMSKVKNETTGNLDFILNNRVLALRSPPGVPQDGEDIATSYTFRVRGNMGAGYEVREFRVENRGQKGGTMVVVYMSDIAIMTGNNVGGQINAVLS